MSETTVVKGQFGLDQSGGTGKKLKYIFILQMSKFQQPALYKGRALDNQWINLIIGSHDLFCGCNKPIKHLQSILPKECHSSDQENTTEKDTTHGDDTGLEPGELEQLFAENDEDKG